MNLHQQKVSWIIAACIMAATGSIWIWLSSQPYPLVKPFLDSFFDKKGFETLNQTNFPVFGWIFRFLGLAFWTCAVVVIFWRKRAWSEFRNFVSNLPRDLVDFAKYLKPVKVNYSFFWLVVLIFVLAFYLRLKEINLPMGYDEAYTYVAFSSSTFQTTISDYHLPNNHVFHSILVYLSTHILGTAAPWAVRLPVFISGLLIVLVVYRLATKMYDRRVALISASLTAYMPVLIFYATDARGYTILTLIWLLTLWLGIYLLEFNNRFAWGVLSILSAIGFYTLPTMLFPYAAVVIWLFLSRLTKSPLGAYHSKLEFYICLLISALSTALLALLLYMPIFLRSGFQLVFENSTVSTLARTDFWPTMLSRMEEIWTEWTGGVPPVLIWLLVCGFLLSLIFEGNKIRRRFPLQWAVLLSIVIIMLARRPNTPARIWVFLVPVILIWGSAGLITLADKISQFLLKGKLLSSLVTGLVLIFLAANSAVSLPTFSEDWSTKGDHELAVLYLKERLLENDLIVVDVPLDAQIWYYSTLHGISFTHFMRELGYQRIFVIVSPRDGQSMDSVIYDRGPSREALSCDAAPLDTIGQIDIYACRLKE